MTAGDGTTDIIVIGAGPCGLAVGIAARQAGIGCVLLDRRNIVSTIERYPLNMTFFSTPERIEIGGIPLVTSAEKPSRKDGLVYYRRVAEHYGLDVRPDHEVTALARDGNGFHLNVRTRDGELEFRSRNVVVATGYYDWPNRLGVPGEDLPHVHHYFREGHPYWHRKVIVIGAGNSSVDAALECWRAGAEVTLVHFLGEFDRRVKPWVLPDITNRVKNGSIRALWWSRVVAIGRDSVTVRSDRDGSEMMVPADAVLAMTGYHADTTLLREVGVPVDPESGVPALNPDTMETPVPGCYVAGVIASGTDSNRLFIENARGHGDIILRAITSSLPD
jgi:thioredoxin reductase (NADPH)